MIIRDYYDQLYGNKRDDLEEMDRFLEKLSLPRLKQEERKIKNSIITSTELEAVLKNLPQKTKAQDQMTLQENSIKHYGRTMPIFLKLFQKIAEERTLPNSFYEDTITLMSKPEKDNTRTKENYSPISRMNTTRANRIQQHIKKLIYHY